MCPCAASLCFACCWECLSSAGSCGGTHLRAGSSAKRPCRRSTSSRLLSRTALLTRRTAGRYATLASGKPRVRFRIPVQRQCRGGVSTNGCTHATVTITQIKMTLQLNINIWLPTGVTQHVVEHEEGHRQISEYYYQTADKVSERIAATYMGKQVEITHGSGAESTKMLNKWRRYHRRIQKGINPDQRNCSTTPSPTTPE